MPGSSMPAIARSRWSEAVPRPAGGQQNFGGQAKIILRERPDGRRIADLGIDHRAASAMPAPAAVAELASTRLLARHGGKPNFSAQSRRAARRRDVASRSPRAGGRCHNCATHGQGCWDGRAFPRGRATSRSVAWPFGRRPLAERRCRLANARKHRDRDRRIHDRGDGGEPCRTSRRRCGSCPARPGRRPGKKLLTTGSGTPRAIARCHLSVARASRAHRRGRGRETSCV